MSGYTKGPWHVSEFGRRTKENETDYTSISFGPRTGQFDASFLTEFPVSTLTEVESNVRLAAAAPDLLDALELLLVDAENQSEALDMEFGSKLRPRKEPYTFDIARAAIARAKGEQV